MGGAAFALGTLFGLLGGFFGGLFTALGTSERAKSLHTQVVPGMRVDFADGWHTRAIDVTRDRVLVRIYDPHGRWFTSGWCDVGIFADAIERQGAALAKQIGLDKARARMKEAT